MDLFIFVLVYPVILFVSILPMRILHGISDILYFFLYYLIGYRKKIVRYNLKLAFPEKSNDELLRIEKKFFHHFVDIFVEMIKSFAISEKEIKRRVIFKNREVVNDFYKKNKSVIVVTGHYANWEWSGLYMGKVIDHPSYGVYKKMRNRFFDKKLKKIRQQFDLTLIQSNRFIRIVNQHKNNNYSAMYVLLSDQSPKLNKKNYWNKFMDVKVPIQNGPEILAKKYNIPIVFMGIKKIRRSVYECNFKIMAENPKDFINFQITDRITIELEKLIKESPEYYLWTHRRFKHMNKLS